MSVLCLYRVVDGDESDSYLTGFLDFVAIMRIVIDDREVG